MIILRKKIHLFLGFVIGLVFIVYQSMTIVREGHRGLLLTKEKLSHSAQTLDSVLKPGLHFTIPFFMHPILLDDRLQTLVFSETSDENNSPEKPITIDYYAHWRISDPIRYYQKTKNNIQQVKSLISQQIATLFHNKNTPIPFNQLILHGSNLQLNSALSTVNKQLKTAGIQLTHIGFKQLRLSAETNSRLLNSMSTEQENKAIALRSEGQANADLIHANADNSVRLILAKAKEQAAQIRAQGDAEAAKIYNQAFSKNSEFAAFYLSLQAYQQGFNQSTMNNSLLLNTENNPLKIKSLAPSKSKLESTN
jgi:modulator of FtsH protease HflC